MVKEVHEKYLNVMVHIKGKMYKEEAAAKTVLLFVQKREGWSKGNEVINVDYLYDNDEMHGADSLGLFEI